MSDSVAPIIGFDFGTTWLRGAVCYGGEVQTIRCSGAERTAAAVAFDGKRVLVGEDAAVRARTDPGQSVWGIKRPLGDATRRYGEPSWDSEQIACSLLNSVVESLVCDLQAPISRNE